jgi:hypothetical protein
VLTQPGARCSRLSGYESRNVDSPGRVVIRSGRTKVKGESDIA